MMKLTYLVVVGTVVVSLPLVADVGSTVLGVNGSPEGITAELYLSVDEASVEKNIAFNVFLLNKLART